MADYSWIDGLSEVKSRPEYTGEISPELAKQVSSGGVTGAILRSTNPILFDPNSGFAEWTRKPIGSPMGEKAVTEILEGPVIGTFGGVNAKTADLSKLAAAETLLASGIDNEVIRQTTGWFKGVDNKWRFEIPDNQAEFLTRISKSKGFNLIPGRDIPVMARGRLGQVLNHDDLFDAYPGLNSILIDTPFGAASRRSPSGAYYKKQPFFPENISINSNIMSDKDRTMRALLHEIEHAIQEREGFSPGGNLRNKNYENLPGEIEARNVAERMKLTPAERKLIKPDSMLVVK